MPPRHRLLVLLAALAVAAGAVAAVAAGQATTVRIDTAAGIGSAGFGGDGGPGTSALLSTPSGLAALTDGALLVADTGNDRIRRISVTGLISTVAGAGPAGAATGGVAGDGLPATDPGVHLFRPRGVAATADGGFLIADTGNHVIRRVSPAGVISTVAGAPGKPGFSGDGGTAVAAQLSSPAGVAALAGGGFLIADTANNRIRQVSAAGIITTVAGATAAGFGGDGFPATRALLGAPAGVTALAGGGFLIADTANNRIRRVDAAGTISTLAGSGAAGSGGDGGPATAAQLNQPAGVTVRPAGSLLVADTGNHRVREIGVDGIVRAAAGTGVAGFAGDGGSPLDALLSSPLAVAEGVGRWWIADSANQRVRVVGAAAATPEPEPAGPLVDQQTPPPGVSPPVVGRRLVAAPVTGTVRVRVRGTNRFVDLASIANLPLGSELDTTRGSVALFFQTTRSGRAASALAAGGRFVVRQPTATVAGERPGLLVLSGPRRNCGGGARASASGSSSRSGRRLRVRANGKIKTKGRYASAIVRGTRWVTVDRCPGSSTGTLVSVSEGVVAVRDFGLRRTVRVSAGRRYLARPRR